MKRIKKQSGIKLNTNKLLVAAGVLIVGLALGYVLRGWLRMSAAPLAVMNVSGNPAEKVLDDEMKQLENPFALLGYKVTEQAGRCHTTLANSISTQVTCLKDIRAYGEINQAMHSKEVLNANAQKLQSLLEQHGWTGNYSTDKDRTSLQTLVSSITSGIDYRPDATYERRIGDVTCHLHSNTAFNAPNPPAMATQLSCVRIFNIFGTPEFE